MKDIKLYINEGTSSLAGFSKDQNYEFWIKSIIEKLTLAFEKIGKIDDPKPEDGWDDKVIKYANDEELYDSIWCLYRCWNASDYSYDSIKNKKIHIK